MIIHRETKVKFNGFEGIVVGKAGFENVPQYQVQLTKSRGCYKKGTILYLLLNEK